MSNAVLGVKIRFRRTLRRYVARFTLRGLVFSGLRAVLLIGMCYIIVFPMLSKISSSFMSTEDLFDQTVKWISRRPTLLNYRDAFYEMEYSLRDS